MSNDTNATSRLQNEELLIAPHSGMIFLIFNTLALLIGIGLIIWGAILASPIPTSLLVTIGCLLSCIICPILYAGLKIVRPNEALVLTLFGKYHGTIRSEGLYYVNPFCTAAVPASHTESETMNKSELSIEKGKLNTQSEVAAPKRKTISLKAMTLDNGKQKINDLLGNPIIIGIVVIWRVENTAKALFNVDNYKEFLSIQCDSALRNIVRLYPYDDPGNDDDGSERSLRGSSQEIAIKLKEEIQDKVTLAGLEIVEARITHLSYSSEIAAAMLQRQQASAIVDARQMIVEGAVGMVKMALDELSENNIVDLDAERKAAMVSNLLVVLCGNKDAQPIVNSGSIY